MAKPSIKGSIIQGTIGDLVRLQEQGRISEETIDARLGPEDLALLETEISPAAWYPIESYARLLQLVGEVEGNGKDAYFAERGRASARRLMEAGLYQQLAFLPRWEETAVQEGNVQSAPVAAFASNLRIVTSLAKAIYNVGEWRVEPDPERPGRLVLEVRDAGAYSEPMRLAIEGFLNECARAAREDLAHLFTSERPARDLIVLRMTRDIMDLRRG